MTLFCTRRLYCTCRANAAIPSLYGDPSGIQLRQTLSIIADHLSVLQRNIHQAIDLHGYQAHEQPTKIARQLHGLLSGHVTFAVRAIDASIIEARTPDSDLLTPSSQLAACRSEASPLQPPIHKQQLPPLGIDTHAVEEPLLPLLTVDTWPGLDSISGNMQRGSDGSNWWPPHM